MESVGLEDLNNLLAAYTDKSAEGSLYPCLVWDPGSFIFETTFRLSYRHADGYSG